MIRHFGQDYRRAEAWADQYTGDTGHSVVVVEVIRPDAETGELYVVDPDGMENLREHRANCDLIEQYNATRGTG
jgi:hypothetical protein